MRSINKVIVIGNLTRNPEMRQTPNGQNVTTFGVATNREWITKDGERRSSAEFHECVAWAHLAEICSKYLKKGNLIYVEGYLKTRSWDSPEGIKKFKTEVVVQDMIMLEKRKDTEEYIPESEVEPSRQDEASGKDKQPIPAKASGSEPLPTQKGKTEKVEKAIKQEAPTEEKSEEESKKAKKSTKEKPEEENPIEKDLGL